MTSVRRTLVSGLTATAGIGTVLLGLAAVDPRVREELTRVASGGGTSRQMASVSGWIQDLGLVVAQALRDQSIEHAPLVIFGIAATILVFFMMRT